MHAQGLILFARNENSALVDDSAIDAQNGSLRKDSFVFLNERLRKINVVKHGFAVELTLEATQVVMLLFYHGQAFGDEQMTV